MDNCFIGPVYTACRTGQGVCIRQVAQHTSFLSRQRDVIASFSFSKPIKTASKLTVGPAGRALPVDWIEY